VADRDTTSADREWPAPLPDVSPQPAPTSTDSSGSRASIYTLRDGSRWLDANGKVERVAPPGTDHHEVRWQNRGLPAMDLAWRRAQTLNLAARTNPNRVDEWRQAVQDLVRGTDADDIALVTAHAWAARRAMEVGSDTSRAETARVAAELLWEAWQLAQDRRTPQVGFEHLRSSGREG
jgi:hypothetical protein